MDLSSEKYDIKFGIKIGSPVEKVVELLGDPRQNRWGQKTYIHDMGETDGVVFFYFTEDGFITEIKWEIGVIG